MFTMTAKDNPNSDTLEVSAMNATTIVEAILANPDQRASDVFQDMTEIKVGGFSFLTKSQRAKRDRGRAMKRRKNPSGLRKMKAAFRRNRSKILQGLKRFARSSRGKRLARARGMQRKRMAAWADVYGNVISEGQAYIKPFEALLEMTEGLTFTRQEMVEEMVEQIVEFVGEYWEDCDEDELQEWYENLGGWIEEHAEADEDEVEDDELEYA